MGKNIAFIHRDMPYGGAETIALNIAKYIIEEGHQAHIITLRQHGNIPPQINVVEILNERKIDSNSCIQKITDKIIELGIEILIVPSGNIFRIAEIKQKTGVKVIYIQHGAPLCEVTQKESNARRKMQASHLYKIKYYLLKYPALHIFKTVERKWTKLYAQAYNYADAFIVLCEAFKQRNIEILKLDASNNKIEVINNATEIEERFNIDNKRREIVYVGRLSYADKRVDRLLHIWRNTWQEFPQWSLTIVGDGAERANLERYAEQNHLQNIKFVGHQNEVGKLLSTASILCLTSAFESWGLVLIEAQSHSAVPIAFNCSDGVQTAVGEGGILVPPGDLERYESELKGLLSNQERLNAMAQKAYDNAKLYSHDVVKPKWIELINKL